MIVIIDNYDSFTYNLAHLVKELGAEVDVLRNDCFALEDLEAYEAGLLLDVIRTYAGRKPILGVCLGEQAIGQVFGGKLTNLSEVFHGVQTKVYVSPAGANNHSPAPAAPAIPIEPDYLFSGLPAEIPVGRYHSWVVDTGNFPEELAITAISPEGQIMALKHRTFDIHGIQFHPESVLTPDGKTILKNWISK